ncbi:sigma-70 family RNA polymerase sigma factor [candidate division WOR-3 bacterium]|nr:sigma-70 family RNA polymerase sigma factor [candidate division WOR-3 bacterium]
MPQKNRPQDPDTHLIKALAGGDEQAFELLVEKYQPMIFNTVYRYLGTPDDVEDCAQEIFIKIWRNINKFKGKSKLSTWIYRITANHCLTFRRKHKRAPVSLDALSEQDAEPKSLAIDPDYETKHKIALVKEAIDRLPERQRLALILSQFEEKTYKEIAEIMDISVSSVESLIFRARTTLRHWFKKK